MTRHILLLASLIATGCSVAPRGQHVAALPMGQYTEASASALAFDPPIAAGEAHPELARAPRANSAFYGFQEQSTEFYVTAFEDYQSDNGDSYQRDAISVRSGVRYR